MLRHYLRKRLSTSRFQIQAKRLCIHAANDSNYVGCDCKIYYFACVKGIKPFEVLLLEGQDG